MATSLFLKQLEPKSKGSLIYYGGSNNTTAVSLDIGTANQVLSVSSGGLPIWTTPASGLPTGVNSGDLIRFNDTSGQWETLSVGSANQYLTYDTTAGTVIWKTLPNASTSSVVADATKAINVTSTSSSSNTEYKVATFLSANNNNNLSYGTDGGLFLNVASYSTNVAVSAGNGIGVTSSTTSGLTTYTISAKLDSTKADNILSVSANGLYAGPTDLSSYYTSSQVDNLLSGKQATLSAGTGISITSNTVSVVQATESTFGGANIATTAQVTTGTDDATIVTPLKLSGALSDIKSDISDIEDEIAALEGAMIYIGTTTLTTAQIETDPTQLNAICQSLTGGPPKLGYVIVDANENDWIYNGTAWIDIGKHSITIANTTTAGIVKASTDSLKITVDASGVMSVNGLSTALDDKQDVAKTYRAVVGSGSTVSLATLTIASLIDVYRNGLLQDSTTDYVYTSGTKLLTFSINFETNPITSSGETVIVKYS